MWSICISRTARLLLFGFEQVECALAGRQTRRPAGVEGDLHNEAAKFVQRDAGFDPAAHPDLEFVHLAAVGEHA